MIEHFEVVARIEDSCCVGDMKIETALKTYREEISAEYVESLLEAAGLRPRESVFSAAVVIWLMIFQRLNPDKTLAAAVNELKQGASAEFFEESNLTLRTRAERISTATGAYSRARTRLPLEVVEKVADKLNNSLTTEVAADTYILDGSVLTVAWSDKNVDHYQQHVSGKKQAHYPLVRMDIAVHATSGYALRPEFGAYSGDNVRSELALAPAVLSRIPKGSRVVADRYFGCFMFVSHAIKQDLIPIVRLRDVVWKRLMQRIPSGCGEQRVLWSPSSHERRRYPAELLTQSEALEGRCIWWTLKRKGSKPTKLLIFTTSDLPTEEIISLYGLRWDIETDLRSLKSTLKLSFISAQTPEMVQKEVILGCVAYNLVRKLMVVAARQLKTSVRKLGFTHALRSVRAFGRALLSDSIAEHNLDKRLNTFLADLKALRLPARKKPQTHPPRRKWGTGKPSQGSRF